MSKVSTKSIIQASVVSAFTIAAALIWKDVIIEILTIFFPGEQLFYKFLVALFATICVVIGIYILLKTEDKAEYVLTRLRKKGQARFF